MSRNSEGGRLDDFDCAAGSRPSFPSYHSFDLILCVSYTKAYRKQIEWVLLRNEIISVFVLMHSD